jgi:transcriptional regulator with XRE-family HTH domain
MQATSSLKSNLGLTQEEVALYLGVSRTQWSMYCIGKRKLPTEAIQKLTDLLTYSKNQTSTKKEIKTIIKARKKVIQVLENKLAKAELKMFLQTKKRLHFDKKQQEIEKSITCIDYLKSQNTSKIVLNLIEIRINKELQTYNETNRLLLITQLNLITEEIKSLKISLKKLMKT